MVWRSGGYTLHAEFLDAGQLVKGGNVDIGGKRVGTIADIRLSDDNRADVVLRITDGAVTPLHRGTLARIRTAGLAGVANRFVELIPGPQDAPEIPDGGGLGPNQTRPIVDLDAVLNALDAPTRRRLQGLLRHSAEVFAGSTAPAANRTLAYFNPAFAQTRAVTDELTHDEAALERLVRSAAPVVTALASRKSDLEQGIGNTATVLTTLGGERAVLQDALARTPGVLRRGGRTLRDLRGTLAVVRPALREAQPVAPGLSAFLSRLAPAARKTLPLLADIRALLPDTRLALMRLPSVAGPALPALASTASALRAATPVFAGLRPYGPDVVAGLFGGLGGANAGYYDANGHYLRVQLNVPEAAGLLTLQGTPLLRGLRTIRSGLNARCPGAAVESALDNSNPWIPDPATCDPEHTHR